MLSLKIKSFKSDGGGEFTSHRFKEFLEINGINHRISCPHTPEQNGAVERKHRYITEMGLTLLAQAHMPLCYWVEAFNTAIFLINRLSSKILQGRSPSECLFQCPPDYNFCDALDVFVFLGYDLITKISWNFALGHVFLLVTV